MPCPVGLLTLSLHSMSPELLRGHVRQIHPDVVSLLLLPLARFAVAFTESMKAAAGLQWVRRAGTSCWAGTAVVAGTLRDAERRGRSSGTAAPPSIQAAGHGPVAGSVPTQRRVSLMSLLSKLLRLCPVGVEGQGERGSHLFSGSTFFGGPHGSQAGGQTGGRHDFPAGGLFGEL